MKRDINYDSMYLKEILPLIDKAAVDAMMCPMGIATYKSIGLESVEAVTRLNSDIAWHNEGIREMVFRLKQALLGEDEDDE